MRKYQAQVTRGIALLDSVEDWDSFEVEDWRAQILKNTDHLVMNQCERCVLGMLFGEYIAGLRAVRIRSGEYDIQIGCGFEVDEGDNYDNDCWSELREEWLLQIGR